MNGQGRNVNVRQGIGFFCLVGALMMHGCGSANMATLEQAATEASSITVVAETPEMTEDVLDESAADVVEDATEDEIGEMTEETVEETAEETTQETVEEGIREESDIPLGHRIIYADGKIFGWTKYQYDDQGRMSMIMFLSPLGHEYWSPMAYDAQGNELPELVGEWSHADENGLITEIGFYDTKGREQLYARYEYDSFGTLTDHWYMYVNGQFLRHRQFQYDPEHRRIRDEVFQVKGDKERSLSLIRYYYDEEGYLLRKLETGENVESNLTVYTFYRYDELGRLLREEVVWGDATHDYVDYIYNEEGKLIQEYHYVENPMMGGSYTKEYMYSLEEMEGH